MVITCPSCHFSKDIPSSRITPGVKFATCPSCKTRFVISSQPKITPTADTPSARKPKQSASAEEKAQSPALDIDASHSTAPSAAEQKRPHGISELDLVPLSSQITCPRCKRQQPNCTECVYCGVVFSKHHQERLLESLELVPLVNGEHQRAEDVGRALACISRGKPIEVLDLLGNILSLPLKILYLTPSIDSHMISSETEEHIIAFIVHHELYDVKVRLNQYAPVDEFRRLFIRSNMNPLLRFCFWLIFFVGYVLNPGRVFGGDFYNPATNVVNIFSNNVGIALHELGHALDFKRRKYPGLYQLSRFIPFVALYQEYKASQYAVQFLREKRRHTEELKAYRILYPAYASYAFGAVYELVPSPVFVIFSIPFIAAGHIIGNIHALLRKAAIQKKGGLLAPADSGRTTQIIRENIRSRGFKLNWSTFGAMGLGFFAGMLLYEFLGAIIGSFLAYFVAQEIIKYRQSNA